MNWAQQFQIIKEIASKKIATAGGRFSLAQLDRLLGITPGKSRHWDKGQRPSADDLELLARKLGLSPRWLLLREGEPEGETSIPADTGETTAQRLESIERYMLKYNAPDEEVRAAFLAALGVNAKAGTGSADQNIPHAEFDQAGNGR